MIDPQYRKDGHQEIISIEGNKIKGIKRMSQIDPKQFWSNCAKNLVWFKEWEQVLDWNPPFARWFLGGKLNAAYNCLDRHLTSEK
jgi:acetyl-CoA synthetase